MTPAEWRDILKKAGFDPTQAFREEQFRGAQAIWEACGRNQSLLLEAPTGTGKTLMYLGALADWGADTPAVISTSGKLLQEQIFDYAVKKLNMDPVILMGRSNYLCQTTCRHYLENMPQDHPLHKDLTLLVEYLELSENHKLSEILSLGKWDAGFVEFVRSHLTASSAFCRNSHEGKNGKCFYEELYSKAQNSSLLILNHHAMFALKCSPLFAEKILIADEAHALPEAASSIFSCSVSTVQLYSLLRRAELCRSSVPGAVQRFQDMVKNLICEIQENAAPGTTVPEPAFWRPFTLPGTPAFSLQELQKCDLFFRNILKELNDSWQEICQFVNELKNLALDPNGVCFFESTANDQCSVKYSPIRTGEILTEFWQQWEGTIGLSATLTLPGAAPNHEFDYFWQKCGFPEPDNTLCLKSPFDYSQQCRIFIPAPESMYDVSLQDQPDLFLEKRIALTGSMINAFNGRLLSLHTASLRLAATAEVLQDLFPGQMLYQGQDGMENDDLAQQFIQDPQRCLLGTRAFFQGFDAPGETLSCEVLEKLTFPSKDDPVLEAECRLAGDDSFNKVVLPAMLMELRQAFGRLIRSEKDHGIFILADPRALLSCYADKVHEALGNITFHQFTSPADILKQIPQDFFSFPLADISGFDAAFEARWAQFRQTALFRKLTGQKSLDDILKKLKIPSLYDWQKEIIDNVLNNVPAQFVIYPAGSGKSLTYQIPALMRPGLTLVISPLKSLMYDQAAVLRAKGIYDVAFINSDLDPIARTKLWKKIKEHKIRLLYVAPERLHKSFIRHLLYECPPTMLVIDEAHMISEAGSQWRPFYGELRQVWKEFGCPQLIALTATAGPNIQKQIQKEFDIPSEHVYKNSVVRSRVKITVSKVKNVEEQINKAVNFVQQAQGKPVLIYCSQVNYIHDLADELSSRSGNLSSEDIGLYYTGEDKFGNRYSPVKLNLTHQKFLNNQIKVLIATNSYGMGIDKPDIWGVLYNNVPISLEELVQGTGRVCRDRKLQQQYSEENHPAHVSATYNPQDLIDQEKWKLNDPFQKTVALGKSILTHLPYSGDAATSVENSSQLLDENALRACMLLARFLRENNLLTDGYMDWKTSAFVFSGLKLSDYNGNLVFKYESWLLGEQKKQQEQLAAVQSFCQTPGCRNEFLQEYFSGSRTGSKCHACDHCPYDLSKHLKYVKLIGSTFESPATVFDNGQFAGGVEEFLEYLEQITISQLPAKLAYLHREHRETQKSYSDAAFAAGLLELKRDLHNAAAVIEKLDFLNGLLEKKQNSLLEQKILQDCIQRWKITEGAELLAVLPEFHEFVQKHNGDSPLSVTTEILQNCRILRDHCKDIQNTANKKALAAWIKQAVKNYADFILHPAWCAAVYYILHGKSFAAWLSTADETTAETEWKKLERHLNFIAAWQENSPEKIQYLQSLIQQLPKRYQEAWQKLLKCPGDYLTLGCFSGREKVGKHSSFGGNPFAELSMESIYGPKDQTSGKNKP